MLDRIGHEDTIHNLKHDTRLGQAYQRAAGNVGAFLIRIGRRFLRNQSARCTWCGEKPGWRSTISAKGTRCNTCLDRVVYGKPLWIATVPQVFAARLSRRD